MNFGDSFVEWVDMFHLGSTSKIILYGHYSDAFPLKRECRQGDPISPYLCIICSEIFALAIKEEKILIGLKIAKKEHKLCQYADDTSVFLMASKKNLRLCLRILQWFYEISGL